MMIKPQLPLESHLSPNMFHSMDSIQQQKLHALSKPRRSHSLKGAFQILLSIYLLSLFFIPYPSWVPTNRKSLKPTVSASISNFLRTVVNRNLMFVIFNALLFVVTRGFGFFGLSSNAVEDHHKGYLARSASFHPSAPIEDEEVIAESLVLVENGVPGIEVEEEGEAVVEEEAAPKGSAAYHLSAPIEDKEVIAESLILVENGVPGIEVEEGESAARENHYRQQHQLQLYHHRRSRPYDHDHHLHHHHYLQLQQLQNEEEEDGLENYSQQQQQDERGGLVLTEESDESFDNFIERVKEGMIMEAKQLLLMG